jgi:hypothetical protein
MRALLPAICLLVAAAMPLPAADLARLLGGEAAAALAAEGSLVRVVPHGAMPGWLPAVDSRAAIVADVRRLDPTISVELLRWYRNLPARFDTADGRLALFNAMRAVSTMKGLTYWSASRGRERELFTLSHAIAGPADLAPLADPVAAALPASDRQYSLQEDQTFGRHVYAGTYENRADHLVVRTENSDVISYLLVPVMKPGGLLTVCVLVPFPDGVLLAGILCSRTTMPVVGRSGREASLLNRLVALSNWVGARLDAPPSR